MINCSLSSLVRCTSLLAVWSFFSYSTACSFPTSANPISCPVPLDSAQEKNSMQCCICCRFHSSLSRDVPRPKSPRTGKAKNVYLRWYFDPFLGKTKYCFKVLAPFQKPVPGTCLSLSSYCLFLLQKYAQLFLNAQFLLIHFTLNLQSPQF